MKALNQTASELMNKLDSIDVKYQSGYFGGSSYCIGVIVNGIDNAFKLGQQLIEYKGVLGVDVIGKNQTLAVIAFRDALVTAG